MTSNKRKKYETDAFDDSFKHRRSSLKVNLSYLSCTSELSDTGHSSLMRTSYIKCNEQDSHKSSNGVITRKKTSSAEIGQYNVIDTHKVVIIKKPLTESKGNISLKDLSVKLVDVYNKGKASKTKCDELNNLSVQVVELNNKEETLKANCEKVKNGILKNTNDIFDEESKLWKETTSALLQGESSTVKVSSKLQSLPKNNSTINPSRSMKVSIESTPKGRNSQKVDTKSLNKDELLKRKVFTNNQIINDNKSLTDNFVCQADHSTRVTTSPMLTGNNKRHDTFNALQRNIPLRVKNYNVESHEYLQDILHKYISDDESIYASSPIACSSFIENQVKISKNTIHCENICNYDICKSMPVCGEVITLKDSAESCNMNLINKVEQHETGMQLVTVSNAILKDLSRASVNSNKDEKICTRPKLCCLSGGSVLNDENVSSLTVNTVMPMDLTTVQDNLQIMEAASKIKRTSCYDSCLRSNNCVLADDQTNKHINRLSLHVNTSIDPINATITEADENVHMQMSGCNNEENKKDVSGFSVRVNTSCDFVCKSSLRVITETPQVCNTYRSKQLGQSDGNNFDLLEDMNLIERIRDYWTTADDNRNSRKTSINVSKRNSADNTGGSSYVKEMPYPVTRSVLLKTQLKNNTEIHNLNTTKNVQLVNCNLLDDLQRRYNTFFSVKELNLEPELLVKKMDPPNIELKSTLSNLSQNLSHHVLNVQGQEEVNILQDSLTDTENKTNDLRAKILDSLKTTFAPKSKRKLLPLTENSELVSLTPVSSVHSSPKLFSLQKKHIIRNKKNLKRATTQKKNVKNVQNNSEKMNENAEIEGSDIRATKKGNSKKHRKILSKKIVVKRLVNQDILRQLQEKVQASCEEKQRYNRLSVDAFDKQKKISFLPFNKSQKIIIVTTGLSKEDKNLVRSVVKSLGKADIHANVTQRTTHVVSTGVRTVNLLHGIIRGCWLVTLHWVLKSLEYNEWLPSEEYEMSHFSKAVQENRKDRQMFGASYVSELFVTCGPIHIESKTTPPRNILRELIKAAGGRITENFESAKVIIGAEGLKESWILDCITTGKLQPFDQYNRV